MGKLAHPNPPRKLSIEEKIFIRIDYLIDKMGRETYCRRLAETLTMCGAWPDTAPPETVLQFLNDFPPQQAVCPVCGGRVKWAGRWQCAAACGWVEGQEKEN